MGHHQRYDAALLDAIAEVGWLENCQYTRFGHSAMTLQKKKLKVDHNRYHRPQQRHCRLIGNILREILGFRKGRLGAYGLRKIRNGQASESIRLRRETWHWKQWEWRGCVEFRYPWSLRHTRDARHSKTSPQHLAMIFRNNARADFYESELNNVPAFDTHVKVCSNGKFEKPTTLQCTWKIYQLRWLSARELSAQKEMDGTNSLRGRRMTINTQMDLLEFYECVVSGKRPADKCGGYGTSVRCVWDDRSGRKDIKRGLTPRRIMTLQYLCGVVNSSFLD
jgi:hypothetical protein